MLIDAGYDVVEAADGLMALGVMEKRAVDLMITDRSMPGLGGLELLGKLKEKKKLNQLLASFKDFSTIFKHLPL